MRKRNLALNLFFILTLTLNAQVFQNVLYGEHAIEKNVSKIYIDKNGDIYPNSIIPNKSLKENNSSIKEFYKNNANIFKENSASIGLIFNEFTENNYIKFQNLLFENKLKKINTNIKNSQVYILIHGFNKPSVPKGYSSSSKQDYEYLQNKILDLRNNDPSFFIEIYWDGMYDCCIDKNTKTNKRIFKLYEEVSQINASRTGYSLRNLVPKINKNEITIITHSLGSQVALSLLTNCFNERVNPEKTQLKTPDQNIHICLIAPSISKEPFNKYFQRNSSIDFKSKDNYSLNILYNEKDFALRKKWKIFGPGPKKYGNTSLGCNHRNEIEKLETIFHNDFKNSFLNTLNTTEIGKTHLVRKYADSKSFGKFITGIAK